MNDESYQAHEVENRDELPETKLSPNPLMLITLSGVVIGVVMAVLTVTYVPFTAPAGDLALPGSGAEGVISDPVQPGKPAPAFTAEGLTGEEVSLSDFKGSVVALNFWATWCAPCVLEMPALQEAANTHDEGNVIVLGVNAGESAGTIQVFVEANSITFPILLDEGGSLVELYGVRGFPTTVWIDRDGIVQAEHLGVLTDELIQQYLSVLLDNEP